ncbi:response regulator transcription factor [Nonomuraea sp. NPDC048916]|uniref:response regulator transcription factor n=1 Tax=Nonomuraea sp. NPDC048916 TaxID=3154232 RepID=UPI00340D93C9
MNRTRVAIADDQLEVREGFRTVVDSRPDMVVVGEAGDGPAALEMVRTLRPDVLLLDIRMPRLDGLEVCRHIRDERLDQRTRVIIVTTFDIDEYIAAALRHGACGFILKRSRPQLLIEAIMAAISGDTLISPELTLRLLRSARTNPVHPAHAAVSVLTPREEEVVRRVARGMTNVEIGQDLFITAGTVKTHLAKVQSKLGVANRVAIAAWAWSVGLVDG